MTLANIKFVNLIYHDNYYYLLPIHIVMNFFILNVL